MLSVFNSRNFRMLNLTKCVVDKCLKKQQYLPVVKLRKVKF